MDDGLKTTLVLSKSQRDAIITALYHMANLVSREEAQDIRELRSYVNAEFIKSEHND